jgi:dTDP-4-dehydrorhamnose reductase
MSHRFRVRWHSARAYRPDDPRNPQSAYGRTKAAGEDAAALMPLLVRTAWVYTAGGANFVRTMLRLMRERDELGVVADQIGAHLGAGTCATIWGLVAGAPGGISTTAMPAWPAGTISPSPCRKKRWRGLLDRAVPILPITTADYPTPARRPAFSLLDCSATRACWAMATVHWRTNLRHARKRNWHLANLLVTGGAGFIGGNFVHYWAQHTRMTA